MLTNARQCGRSDPSGSVISSSDGKAGAYDAASPGGRMGVATGGAVVGVVIVVTTVILCGRAEQARAQRIPVIFI